MYIPNPGGTLTGSPGSLKLQQYFCICFIYYLPYINHRIVIQISGFLAIRTSGQLFFCPFGLLAIWTSGHLDIYYLAIWTSGHPDIWTSGLLVIRSSGHPDFWSIGLLVIWTSSHLDFKSSGLLAIWTSGHLTFYPKNVLIETFSPYRL